MAALYAANPPGPEPAGARVAPPSAGTPGAATELRAWPAVPNPDLRTVFHVKFVQQDAAYIDAGRNEGISEGMKLVVVNAEAPGAPPARASAVAELTVVGIAETSAVPEIHVIERAVVAGDWDY